QQMQLDLVAPAFAFPEGQADARVRALLKASGFTIGLGGVRGVSTLADDPMNLPRVEIFRGDDIAAFAQKIDAERDEPDEIERDADSFPLERGLPKLIPMDQASLTEERAFAEKLLAVSARLGAVMDELVGLRKELLERTQQSQLLQKKLHQLF